ncbi:bifunctional DNA primase/helicase [Sphingomonas sp. LY29]|uniref:bifunctional DNA primase/helicase n=1 Tax=Sphingomonas sp. LY29 TaxID=3095341 RepID=UPI002D79B0CC|nr:bifunctional DNA primase/helicase [Sphingomonas sp. LY29]WRP25638.1 bifunctional DNA primase/helicase [Sphingomonas sp. LY29]
MAKLGFETVRDGAGQWLQVPFIEAGKAINHKRRLTSRKDFRMDDGAPLTLWNHDCMLDPRVQSGEQAVIVTEGEMDAAAVIQSGFPFVVSVPNGAPANATDDPLDAKRYAYLERLKPLWKNVGKFILCGDGDGPGQALNHDLARIFGPWRCKFVRYGTDAKDLGDMLRLYGESSVVETINAALDWPVSGLYRVSEIPSRPTPEGMPCGIDGIDDMFRLVPGTFTVVSGFAGNGKTSLLLTMLANLMQRGVTMAVASFETLPRPILERRLKSAIMGVPEFHPEAIGPSDADDILEDKLRVICQLPQDEDEEMDLTKLLDLAATAVVRDGVKLLVIDPWNEIEHKRGKDESETDYTGRAIREIKRFARNTDCAVWLVAHPAKPDPTRAAKMPGLYHISGSANWANKADYGFIVHRENKETNLVQVAVTKVRMGLPGKEGIVTLALDYRNMSYTRPARQFEGVAANG